MENNHNIPTINDFDFNLICEYFALTEHQGPGSEASTLRALSFIDLTDEPAVADIGCGTGSSALVLARELGVSIAALDLFPQFIDILRERAADAHVRVDGMVGSMEQMPFAGQSLDLIWCEGAIYNIGFKRGMREWHSLLREGGYIAVTEPTWLTDSRPEAITDFWNDAYPEVMTLPQKVQVMMDAGYSPVAAFVLPDSCWTENYYIPQRAAQEKFLQLHSDQPFAAELVRNQRHEAEMYDRYKQYYGYVFYIGKKI